MAQILTHWEPILASVSTSASLAMRLIDQVEKYKKSKQLAQEIGENIAHLQERFKEFKQGSDITALHAIIEADYRREIDSINKKMEDLADKIRNKKIFFFWRAISIYGDLRDIKSCVASLKSQVYNFGQNLNISKKLGVIDDKLDRRSGQLAAVPAQPVAEEPQSHTFGDDTIVYYCTKSGKVSGKVYHKDKLCQYTKNRPNVLSSPKNNLPYQIERGCKKCYGDKSVEANPLPKPN